jgi:hypothetical protein
MEPEDASRSTAGSTMQPVAAPRFAIPLSMEPAYPEANMATPTTHAHNGDSKLTALELCFEDYTTKRQREALIRAQEKRGLNAHWPDNRRCRIEGKHRRLKKVCI